jgi:hypothetical protein
MTLMITPFLLNHARGNIKKRWRGERRPDFTFDTSGGVEVALVDVNMGEGGEQATGRPFMSNTGQLLSGQSE